MAGPDSVSTLLLRNVPLFASLPEGQLALLTRVVGRKSHPRNSTIINAGDPTDALYIVISGRLKVMMSDDEGREVILAILGQGEFFGEMGLIDEAPRSATVIAIEPCELLTINKMDFRSASPSFEIGVGVMKGW
jgi:CRP/FNR family cyclic AMP-dependent transcriptional regulator